MTHLRRNSLAAFLALASATTLGAIAHADGPGPATSAPVPVPAPPMPPDLPRRVWEVTDVVLEHHIDPPTRQQMIVSAIRTLHRQAGVPVPMGLARRVSAIATPEPLAAMLREFWPKTTARPISADRLEEALFGGLLAPAPGHAVWMTAKESQVAEQMAGNRYVGIHVALSWHEDEKRPVFQEVFPGGPADKAGVRADDRLEAVDGVDTHGMDLRRVVDRLRGDEGTDVTIAVRSPKESKARTLKITRGQLPRPTIEGIRKQTSGDWTVHLDGSDPIGYLKIKEIAASTPHELRKLARQMEDQGIRALVLDLRDTRPRGGESQVHPAVLLADSLLESGPIGRVRTVRGETTYQADPDALFRGWPIAVLVDQTTTGTAEWVAAALQDNRRATIVGWSTRGAHRIHPAADEGAAPALDIGVTSTVPVGDGRWAVSLVTGSLERGDGRPASGVQPDHRLPAIPATARGPEPMAGARPVRVRRPADRAYAAVEPEEPPRSPADDPALQAARTILHRALETR